jgi:hypothetical protein
VGVHLGASPSVDAAVSQEIPNSGGITSHADTLYYKCAEVETGGNQQGGRFKHRHEILLNTAAIANENTDGGNIEREGAANSFTASLAAKYKRTITIGLLPIVSILTIKMKMSFIILPPVPGVHRVEVTHQQGENIKVDRFGGAIKYDLRIDRLGRRTRSASVIEGRPVPEEFVLEEFVLGPAIFERE